MILNHKDTMECINCYFSVYTANDQYPAAILTSNNFYMVCSQLLNILLSTLPVGQWSATYVAFSSHVITYMTTTSSLSLRAPTTMCNVNKHKRCSVFIKLFGYHLLKTVHLIRASSQSGHLEMNTSSILSQAREAWGV